MRVMEVSSINTEFSIVFSYRTSILEVANMALRSAEIHCLQLDGKLSARRRNQIVNEFSTNESVQVLLLSLGCGAVG